MLTLITGGARSGKSTHAQRLASQLGGSRVAFIATCVPTDEEMSERIRRHQADRPSGWRTIEEAIDLSDALNQAALSGAHAVIIDCLTLWLFNATERGWTDDQVVSAAQAVARNARALEPHVIAVTNEVGWGIVPATEAGRRFRDLQGGANQLWAAESDEVVLVVAGLPVPVKRQGAGP